MNTATLTVTEVSAIPILKRVYEFLAPARQNPRGLKPSELQPHFQHVIFTDGGLLMTTDGFRMHIYPTSGGDAAPGFYDWSDESKALVRIDDAAIPKKVYLGDALFYPRIMRGSRMADPMLMYSWHRHVVERDVAFPPVRAMDHTIVFRRGTYEGETRAICLGVNAPPFEWDRDGIVTIAPREQWTAFEAKFFFDAMTGGLVRPVIRWDGYRDPIILGNVDGPHAIIMPLVGRN